MTIEDDEAIFLRCIGEPTRLRILKLLAGGDRCVGEIVESLDEEQSLISHHLRAMKGCGIVLTRREAQKIYYELADARVAELIFNSESIMKGLPLCQTKGADYEKA